MKKTSLNAGETLVEVMASIVIFLLMVGILQGAVSYSNAALKKSRQLRAENEEIFESLNSTSAASKKGSLTLNFRAESKDGKTIGNQVFSVKSDLYKKKAFYHDEDGNEKTTNFYLYKEAETTGGGGDSP